MNEHRALAASVAFAAALLTGACAGAPGKRTDGGIHARGVARAADSQQMHDTDPAANSVPPPEAEGADAPSAQDAPPAEAPAPQANVGAPAPAAAGEFPPGLIVTTLREGDGDVCALESLVIIRYEGRVQGGPVFARTPAGGQDGPWPVASMVAGLRDGMVGLREGGRRRIVVPPELGYADVPVTDEATGDVTIPAGSTLVFTVELLDVRERTTGAPTDD